EIWDDWREKFNRKSSCTSWLDPQSQRCASVGIDRSGHRDYGRVNRLEITPFPV
ncbi:unnamed protein product, partial [Ascophyllum nodosum]